MFEALCWLSRHYISQRHGNLVEYHPYNICSLVQRLLRPLFGLYVTMPVTDCKTNTLSLTHPHPHTPTPSLTPSHSRTLTLTLTHPHPHPHTLTLTLTQATDSLSFNTQQSINMCQSLSPHLNICLIRSLMHSHPSPPKLLPQSQYYILTDHTTHNVNSFLLTQKNTLSQDSFIEMVLLTLTQLFSALSFLHSYGVCHRDVGIESLYGRKTAAGHWIVSLGDFSYAIHRPGPVTATTFVYGYHELKWLGGMDCRLPPEVIDTTRNCQTVNYGHTDSFSAGCLIYDLCGGGNPFELDSSLVFSQYSDGDLPRFESSHKTSLHLYKLATLLLKKEPSKRVSLSTALLVCQALQWLPEEWILEPISEGHVRYQLEVEKASLVAQMARSGSPSMPLNLFLKADFLLNCNASELIRALSLFTQRY